MTNVEILKKLNVYDEFVHNLKNLSSSDYTGENIDEHIESFRAEDLISCAFIWPRDKVKYWWGIEEQVLEMVEQCRKYSL